MAGAYTQMAADVTYQVSLRLSMNPNRNLVALRLMTCNIELPGENSPKGVIGFSLSSTVKLQTSNKPFT